MLPVLIADRLSKRYGAQLAVDDVSFAVEAGEVMGLLGPNGSGKTTILRLLTGYLHPSSGTARIAGFDREGHIINRKPCTIALAQPIGNKNGKHT